MLEKACKRSPRIGSSSISDQIPRVTTLEELADFFVALSRHSIKSKALCSP